MAVPPWSPTMEQATPPQKTSAIPKTRDAKYLVNKLNYINFQNSTVLVILRNVRFDRTLTFPARPEPCLGGHLDCHWTEPTDLPADLFAYRFDSLLVPDGQKYLLVHSEAVEIGENGICLLLPDSCQETTTRSAARFPCMGVKAKVIQNSSQFLGTLLDFSPLSFRVEICVSPPQTFRWINSDLPLFLLLENDREVILSIECKILRQGLGQERRHLVLEPLHRSASRFAAKQYRSHRFQLLPSPSISFRHPLSGKLINLRTFDISGSGVSVTENRQTSVLFAGMIIPELEIRFPSGFHIHCRAQIIYKKKADNGESFRCGIAFLDMGVDSHLKLQSLLHQANDQNTYVCNNVDIDDLWNFFFETGFIYPSKYQRFSHYKDDFKELFRKIYLENPKIARHFIYQDNGEIFGHMAMIRFFSASWLIHHHAASKAKSKRAGLKVLAQIGRSIRDSQNLYSSRMNYVMAYFRKENKFPRKVFGGVAQFYGDRKGCSIDSFAYFDFQNMGGTPLHPPWRLVETSRQDLMEIGLFYENESGGLLIQAFDLEPSLPGCDEIIAEYNRFGLKRERYLFSLKRNNSQKAIFIVNLADLGLNLSELTSSIHVLILDTSVEKERIISSINSIFRRLNISVPVLIYPDTFMPPDSVIAEKNYHLWILNCQNLDPYFEFCDSLFRQV